MLNVVFSEVKSTEIGELFMAQRPVFTPCIDGPSYVLTKMVDFKWFAGMVTLQKQKSIDSLHVAAHDQMGVEKVLEVSSKSRKKIGVELSAFNLSMALPNTSTKISVECAFQGSKVFENGGPYIDIFSKTSLEAKKDERLRSSGRLTNFHFFGNDWLLEPQTAFYDWLYINALKENANLAKEILEYSGFTDIEFNPKKSINCQAHSVALFVSLYKREMLDVVTSNKDDFLKAMKAATISNAQQDKSTQGSLF
jgi:hypothetical protein